MIEAGLIVVFTSLLSSLLTWVIAYIVFRTRLERRLDQQVARLQEEFEIRVKNGVRAAGVELLPELREQVKLGFIDAVNKSTAAGFVEETARAVSTGAGLVESGLNVLLGIGKSSKK
jgi:hypothetical protein